MAVEVNAIPFSLWETDKQAFAHMLVVSLEETGFAAISEHTISDQLIADVENCSKDFFNLPLSTKKKYQDSAGGHQRGYSPLGTENAKGRTEVDQKEFWHTGRELPANSPLRKYMKDTPCVYEVKGFDDKTREIYEAFDAFGASLLSAIAIYLEIEETWFENKINFGNSILRLLHYPPQTQDLPDGSVRAAAHEDINLITLLIGAEEAGLQCLHRSGNWIDIKPPAGTLVMNAGDMLERLTAGFIPSTTHRVLNPSRERAAFSRYSMPYFLHFNNDYLIEALPQCVAKGFKEAPPITAGDYLYQRLVEIGLLKAD